MSSCVHGERTRREGTNKFGKPYVAEFCAAPKGTPDQCKPIFLNDGARPGALPPTVSPASSATPAWAFEMMNSLSRIEKKLNEKDAVPTDSIPF
jgi:hypothetical protein